MYVDLLSASQIIFGIIMDPLCVVLARVLVNSGVWHHLWWVVAHVKGKTASCIRGLIQGVVHRDMSVGMPSTSHARQIWQRPECQLEHCVLTLVLH